MNTPTPLALTARQKQIGICLLAGMPLKKIAHYFGISINTIREHQTCIKKKLLCQNAYQVGSKLATLFQDDAKNLKIYLDILSFGGDHPHF